MSLTVKDIHENIYGLLATGKKREALEALLIHSDDLIDLLESISKSGHGESHHDMRRRQKNGEIRVLGVKIVESLHVPKGSIFKVFKQDNLHITPQEMSAEYMSQPEDGVLSYPYFPSKDPNGPFSYAKKYILPNMDFPPNIEWSTGNPQYEATIPGSGNLNIPKPVDEKEPEVEEKKEVPKRQKRHSETRKIHLD